MTSAELLEMYKKKLKEVESLRGKLEMEEQNNVYINGIKASQADIRRLVKDIARGMDVSRHETEKGAIAFVTNY